MIHTCIENNGESSTCSACEAEYDSYQYELYLEEMLADEPEPTPDPNDLMKEIV